MTTNESPQDQINPPLTNVHSCLEAAAFESSSAQAMVPFSLRLPEGVRDQARAICRQNCTDLATYLRECTRALIRDYGARTDE